MHLLSGAQISYLHAVEKLSKESITVRTAYVAKEIGVTRASAHKMLGRLEEQGIIEKDSKNSIVITAAGHEVCKQINTKFNSVYNFFKAILGLDEDESLKNTYAFIGEFSEKCVDSLIAKFEKLELYA